MRRYFLFALSVLNVWGEYRNGYICLMSKKGEFPSHHTFQSKFLTEFLGFEFKNPVVTSIFEFKNEEDYLSFRSKSEEQNPDDFE